MGYKRELRSPRILVVTFSVYPLRCCNTVPIKQVRFIRGNIRRTTLDARLRIVRLLNYNAKQLPGSFLTTQQAADLQTTATDLLTLLEAKRFI